MQFMWPEKSQSKCQEFQWQKDEESEIDTSKVEFD